MASGRQLPRQVRVAERRSGRRRAAGVSQRTTEFYEEAVRRHLVKGLGRVPLCKLSPRMWTGTCGQRRRPSSRDPRKQVEATLKVKAL